MDGDGLQHSSLLKESRPQSGQSNHFLLTKQTGGPSEETTLFSIFPAVSELDDDNDPEELTSVNAATPACPTTITTVSGDSSSSCRLVIKVIDLAHVVSSVDGTPDTGYIYGLKKLIDYLQRISSDGEYSIG